MKKIGWAACAVFILLGLGGCATSRSVVTVEAPKSENPVQGQAIKIVKVDDARRFAIAPDKPDTPSLSDDDINNKATTSRAIARKRNTYGMALGDVLLPEEKNVAAVVQGAVEEGFRTAGFRVFSAGQPGSDEAVPVSVDIHQFWAWMTPGFWALTLEHKSEITLQAPTGPLATKTRVDAYAVDNVQMGTESAWQEIVAKGLAALTAKVKESLSAGRVASTGQ